MSLLKKFFNFSKPQDSSKNERNPDHETFEELQAKPIDELFTINFRNNGGKFLYCESMDEVYESFSYILMENNWVDGHIFCLSEHLINHFSKFKVDISNRHYQAPCFLSGCEFLVADTGAILISSEQIKEKNIKDFPEHFIIFATTSQLVKTISDGLQGIKMKHINKIPSNITSIKNFDTGTADDFMTYGSSSKKLYLLLLEDLSE